MSYAERLLVDDQVLVRLTARRDGLHDSITTDRLMGRPLEARMVNQLKSLEASIKRLKEHQLL